MFPMIKLTNIIHKILLFLDFIPNSNLSTFTTYNSMKPKFCIFLQDSNFFNDEINGIQIKIQSWKYTVYKVSLRLKMLAVVMVIKNCSQNMIQQTLYLMITKPKLKIIPSFFNSWTPILLLARVQWSSLSACTLFESKLKFQNKTNIRLNQYITELIIKTTSNARYQRLSKFIMLIFKNRKFWMI